MVLDQRETALTSAKSEAQNLGDGGTFWGPFSFHPAIFSYPGHSPTGPDSGTLLLLDTNFITKVYVRFSNKSEIEKSEIVSIEEEYKSAKNNYIIATVNFKSLFHFCDNHGSKVLICEV